MSVRVVVRIAAMAASLGLAACASLQPTPTAVVVPDRNAEEVIALLDQFDRLADGSPEDQRREFGAAQAAFESNPGEFNRLRLALVLSLPRVPWRDDARIITLLADSPASGPPSLHRQVTLLVYRMAVERVRVAKEDQRRAERLEASLREEQRKAEELQQKLGALRAIDRELRRRP